MRKYLAIFALAASVSLSLGRAFALPTAAPTPDPSDPCTPRDRVSMSDYMQNEERLRSMLSDKEKARTRELDANIMKELAAHPDEPTPFHIFSGTLSISDACAKHVYRTAK